MEWGGTKSEWSRLESTERAWAELSELRRNEKTGKGLETDWEG